MLSRQPHVPVQRWELFDPRELDDELDTACASGDHFDDMEARERARHDEGAVLRHCHDISEIASRGCVLGIVRQTMRIMCFTSDHFFHVVQILDAGGIGSKTKQVQEQAVAGRAALSVGVKVDHSTQVMAADVEHGVLRGLQDKTIVFLNGIFEDCDVFPNDIMMAESD